MVIKIAVVENSYNRAKFIKKLIKESGEKTTVKTFRGYKGVLPDTSFDAYIYTGGKFTVNRESKHPYLKKIERSIKKLSKKNKAILGICLGHQIISDTFGGKISKMDLLKVGFQRIEQKKTSPLLKNVSKKFWAFTYQEYKISKIPKNFENFAFSKECKIQHIKHKTKNIYGIQFHIEYDKKTIKEIFKYTQREEDEFDKLASKTSLYSRKVSRQIMGNFLDIAKSNKK